MNQDESSVVAANDGDDGSAPPYQKGDCNWRGVLDDLDSCGDLFQETDESVPPEGPHCQHQQHQHAPHQPGDITSGLEEAKRAERMEEPGPLCEVARLESLFWAIEHCD